MDTATLQLMHDHLGAIYRALTGSDLPSGSAGGPASTSLSADDVARSFAEVEVLARSVPTVAERVPPFSFSPPLDVFATDRELAVDVGVPGIERDDVRVTLRQDQLVVEGVRRGETLLNGHTYFHAELPRGPFRRVVQLPHATVGEPRVEVAGGVVRVRIARGRAGAQALG